MRNGLRDKMWYSSEVKHSSTYEDALNVTRALRAMANPAPSKQSGVTAWARQRLRTFSMHDRAQAQTLDALAAPQDHGGPAKLSDAQVDLTSRWLTRSSIENFCKGEERVHRFCFEVRKCVNNLVGESLLESPVLWSSCLYQHEKEEFVASSRRSGARSARDENLHGLSTSVFVGLPTSPTLPSARFKISESSRSPNNASPQWNEFSQPWRGPPPTSDDLPGLHWPRSPMGPSPQVHVGMPTLHLPFAGNSTAFDGSNERISSKSLFIGHLKQSVTSLLLSDLGYIGWNYGSETDRWVIDDRTQPPANMPRDIFTVLGQRDVLANAEPPAESTNTVVDSRDCIGRRSSIGHVNQNDSNPKANAEVELPDLDSPFPYVEVYKRILEKFALSSNPQSKLKALYELTLLATNAYEESMNPSMNQDQTVSNTNKISNQRQASWTRNIGVPRTRATRLEEVMANCEERRANTMLHNQSNQRSSYRRSYPFNTPILDNALSADALGNNHVVPILQSIFRDGSLRPKTLFRDLQYIAAFVPSSVLDNTPEGKAFWDTGLAALSLKADICKSMITHANDIVLHHLNNSNAAKKPNSSIATDRESSDPSQSSLAEAARLYLIAAQEGDPTAARELALFYLTHPELVPRATLALSRPSEVFKVRSSSLGSDRGSEGKQREGILDPLTFAVAFHWMEFAANGGDKDAKAFFKENGELGRG
ncbi:hypothetical protein MMC06_003865 [Schaereria dolodes]|nr:hypothetical protein [Schaereria dolodes]